jgi:multiple antibiotic resistance protein
LRQITVAVILDEGVRTRRALGQPRREATVRLFGTVFVTILVILDPPGMVPIFVALTQGSPRPQRRRAALQAVGLAAGVIGVFAVAGQQILLYLGIRLPALEAAGGALLLLVALQQLTGRPDDPARPATSNVALVPIGTPLLAGPGAIVATMLFVQRAGSVADDAVIAAGITLALVTVWVTLLLSEFVVRLVRPTGIDVLTRIAGLLLAAIAVQLVADAVAAFVHSYARS